MTLTFGHVCIAIVYVHFLESFDVRTKRTAYSKTVSKLVRTELKILLMYILTNVRFPLSLSILRLTLCQRT
jgi:hypothetical protein